MAKNVNFQKEVFTTFEVARICNANITSIKNWIEDGEIRAFRTPGGHYRIERGVLIDFLDRYSMPNPFTTSDEKRIVLYAADAALPELLRRQMGRDHDIQGSDDIIEGGFLLGLSKPNVLVAEVKKDSLNGLALIGMMRKSLSYNSVRVIALTDESISGDDLKNLKIHYTVSSGEGFDALVEKIRQALV